MVAYRLLVEDVERGLAFYRDLLGFSVVEQWGPAIAIIEREGVRVWLSGPQTSAARAMPDGEKPVPGGWNRIAIGVDDLENEVARLRTEGVEFRNETISGPGGMQILAKDGVGNFVEFFESK